jgi:hypothetical protein
VCHLSDRLKPIPLKSSATIAGKLVLPRSTLPFRNTWMAYARAVKQFLDWREGHRLSLDDVEPIANASYYEQLRTSAAKRR